MWCQKRKSIRNSLGTVRSEFCFGVTEFDAHHSTQLSLNMGKEPAFTQGLLLPPAHLCSQLCCRCPHLTAPTVSLVRTWLPPCHLKCIKSKTKLMIPPPQQLPSLLSCCHSFSHLGLNLTSLESLLSQFSLHVICPSSVNFYLKCFAPRSSLCTRSRFPSCVILRTRTTQLKAVILHISRQGN